jgi:hypothetical protein
MSKHLLHTGFAKSGSSFLQKWFDNNPLFCFSPQSFGGFRDDLHMAEELFDREHVNFSYYVTSSEVLGSGFKVPYKCPLYAFTMMKNANNEQAQINACKFLSEAYPNAKILIVTRGFESIIRSLYSEYIKCGGKLKFKCFLNDYTPLLTKWLDYDVNLKLYMDAFGESNVIVLPFELLQSNPTQFIKLVEKRLDIPHVDCSLGIENPSLTKIKLYGYSCFSRFIISPTANLLSEKNAAKFINFYSFMVIRPDNLSLAISIVNIFFKRKEYMEFPNGYFENFKGKADLLNAYEYYLGYKNEYFISKT